MDSMELRHLRQPEISPELDQTARWLTITILLLVASYQALLCFINTKVFGVSRSMIGVAEAMIMLACLPILMRRLLPGVMILICLVGAMLCLLTLFSGQINLKALRDLIIPLIFFWLGRNVGRPLVGDRIIAYLMVLVLVVGLVELLFLDFFTSYMNIYHYYVNTGSLLEITDYAHDSSLQLNGNRPEGIGRTLLPGLFGSHRVSSIFLEPVSLGNFATLTIAWWLCRDRSELKASLWMLVASVILIVMADSRFALITVSMLVFVRIVVLGRALNFAVLAPLVGMGLIILMSLITPESNSDDYAGRLVISGMSLLDFDYSTLLGIPSGHFYGDQGYAYALSGFGLPLSLILWLSLWMQPVPDQRAARFRAFSSLYIALLLCISGTSLFAFKSAGLLWFLIGCSLCNPAPLRRSGHHPIWLLTSARQPTNSAGSQLNVG